ncbi:MAG: DoxX family protein [Chthoniobacterales bacterium]|nr:DoxX family protein [Chthoniobacterales bacterium]
MFRRLLDLEFCKRHRDYAPLFLRLLIGAFIIHGVQDNILNAEQMTEFEKFLMARGVPAAAIAAPLSVYAQFICGVSILLGAWIRLTSVVFIINFVCAIVIAHLGQSFHSMFPALMIIAAGLFFLFNGAGRLSIDSLLEQRGMVKAGH